MLAAEPRAASAALSAAPSSAPPPSWRSIVGRVEPFLRAVAQRLEDQVKTFEPEIAGYARYALTNQGKQLRPALVALSAEATGGLNDDLVTIATIVEIVHLATLVHDDIMDEARMRRRRPTLAVKAGNSISVLAGDCLFAHALQLAAGFPTPDVCRAVAGATKTVCTGEILQTLRERRWNLPREEYFRMLRMKTGELFALSCLLGARISGAAEREQRALRDYGMSLGTAYQVYDDCVDLFGREVEAGKSLGSDLAGGKITLPVIVALEEASPAERTELERMLTHWEPAALPRLGALLEAHDALGKSVEAIRALCGAARDALDVLPPGEQLEALLHATDFVAQQTRSLGVHSWERST